MKSLFARKPIAELLVEGDHPNSLKRALGAGDLVMLAIGAVIGAGIFGAIGTAAAGQLGPNGEVIRSGAGPALVFSFLLLGGVCALAALCYAELASMIPQAGSAYAYTYATLGEIVAWIIGWDLILEYAVGNVAVAISWGDYFKVLTGGLLNLPVWLTTGYRTALLSSDPKVHGLLESAPHVAGVPILVNVPAATIVLLITWLLLRGVRESARANNIMVVVKLLALALFVGVGLTKIDPANYHPFAPNGFEGIHHGAAIVFFAYIGFDAISTAAEETINPQRNLPIGILGGLAICTLVYVIVGAVLTGMVPYRELDPSLHADPLAYALQRVGMQGAGWLVALGARRAAAEVGGEGAPEVAGALRHHAAHRIVRRQLVADRRRRRDVRPDEHRHAVRVRPRVHRRARAAVHAAGASAAVSRPLRLAGVPGRGRGVRVRDVGAAAPRVGALHHLARHRARAVLPLRLPQLDAAPQRSRTSPESLT
jgi:APA family basic amino acid/polyamine antiporter